MLMTDIVTNITVAELVVDRIRIKVDLNEIETEACGKCALCYMNGDYCSECTRGDDGCPVDAYVQMEVALAALKEE